MRQFIGLSTSFCVRDILDGKVEVEEVLALIPGTKALTEDDWEEIITGYTENYWTTSERVDRDHIYRRDRTAEARQIITKLRLTNRIVMPRVNGQYPSNIAHGHWLMFDWDQGEWRQCSNIGKS